VAVYFIQNPDTGHIKIGKSFMVQERLKALSRQEGAPLKLLGVIKGYGVEEADLHLHFDAIRLHGEWFDSTSELIEFIADQAIPLDNLQEVPPVKSLVIQSKISDLAKERGFKTPEALSKATDLTRTTMYNVWTGDIGNRKFETLYIIAGALNVPIEHLFEIVES
jgi:hypothetical protein